MTPRLDIRHCAQNNIGNIIQYHSIHIISIIQCRFNITTLGKRPVPRTVSYRDGLRNTSWQSVLLIQSVSFVSLGPGPRSGLTMTYRASHSASFLRQARSKRISPRRPLSMLYLDYGATSAASAKSDRSAMRCMRFSGSGSRH